MLEKIFLGSIVIFALATVQSKKLRRAAVYLGIFSLMNSFAYVFYGAPDVAMAEAIIGTTLSTVLYLVAMKKYKVFTICFAHSCDEDFQDRHINKGRNQILKDIEYF